ncbi:MAG TPA: HAMP domain-containing sensor histidine kinase [Myxococcaceae bacterium]|nr:HAMP domain-containing sensor histidine kinase [Myxococcaceae bacterium]
MPNPSYDLLSFRRTFALLMVLVALPSAGLSGLGVVAILNERAAVEQRMGAVWHSRLDLLAARFRQALEACTVAAGPDGSVEVKSASGRSLAEESFRVDGDAVIAPTGDLASALTPLRSQLAFLPSRPSFLSVPGTERPYLIVAERTSDGVVGARLDETQLDGLLDDTGRDLLGKDEAVHFALVPAAKRDGSSPGLVGRLISGVATARTALAPTPVASRPLSPPFQEFQIQVVPMSGDPVAAASTRNRLVYGLLLGVFYVTFVVGVVYTARALYLHARLSRLKTDFVSLVSHELRTPLTSIRMFIETLALGRVVDERQTQEVLGLLKRETERLSEMIEAVLDWSRLESGHHSFKKERLEVRQVVDTSLEAFRAQRLEATVALSADVPEGLPAIEGDREALAGALLNLLHNAYKYGGSDKRIALRAHPEKKGVAIEVEDHGVGISKRDRRRVFDRFYRADNLLTRDTEGSGLGLSISRRIVEAHGGSLTLESELGQGSTFTVHLPRARA